MFAACVEKSAFFLPFPKLSASLILLPMLLIPLAKKSFTDWIASLILLIKPSILSLILPTALDILCKSLFS